MTTLEDLYYGNISPHERYIKRGTRVDIVCKVSAKGVQEPSEKTVLICITRSIMMKTPICCHSNPPMKIALKYYHIYPTGAMVGGVGEKILHSNALTNS